ncbi:MAG: hypothetical protein KDD66_17710 [Bdellovibrionales bacterium]|nr:hypothetical protein [Bdellovibrionales bacterium]
MIENFNTIRHRSLRIMLRPIVRFWLRGADSIQSFIDSLKIVFVEVAVEELARQNQNVNLTQISLLSGVHRPDVSKIVKRSAPPDRSVSDVVTRVIGQWEQDSRFCAKDGKPRSLGFKGKNSEFSQLVRCVSKDVTAGSVLSALLQRGTITKGKDTIKLSRSTHKITSDQIQSFDILARDTQTLMNAVQENIEASTEASPHVHLRTEFDNIFESDLPKIRVWLRKECKAFHRKARAFLSKCDKDLNDRPGEKAGAVVSLSAFGWTAETQLSSWYVGSPLDEARIVMGANREEEAV